MATGAHAIVATLEAAGVEACFGLPGVHNLPLWEALRRSPIRLVGVRHEQAAVYAADGYARATGRLGLAPITARRLRVETAGTLAETAARAVAAPLAHRRPAYLEIPTDLLGADAGDPE